MKKTYICPEAIVVNIDAESLIATSPTIDTEGSTGDENNFAAPSYRSSIWGD